MTQPTKPEVREWWINKNIGSGGDVLTPEYKAAREEHTSDLSNYIHVVEQSAYLAVLQWAELCREGERFYRREWEGRCEALDYANEQIAELQAKLKECEQKLQYAEILIKNCRLYLGDEKWSLLTTGGEE